MDTGLHVRSTAKVIYGQAKLRKKEKPDKEPRFSLWDYVVFGGSICLCMGIGLYHAVNERKRNTTSEYLLGNRRLLMLPVAISMIVTFESSIMMLGYPAEIYTYGVMPIWVCLTLAVAFLIGARILVPLFHPLKITSMYEYLELRYKSRGPRILCTIFGSLHSLFYLGIVLYGPALALEAVLDFPLWLSILVTTAVATIYTALGGIKAVVWTDVIQCLTMNVGLIAIIVQGVIVSGGLASVWERNEQYRRLNFFDFNPNPGIRHTFWTLVVGTVFRYLALVFNQSTVQRVSAVQTLKEAKRLLYIGAPLFSFMMALVIFEGLVIFAYFNTIRCDPIESEQISNANQIAPFVVLRIFHFLPGMAGLFMAAVFSASLSTLSSGLSSLSAQFTEDFVRPHFKNMSEAQLTIVAKISVLAFGVIAVGIAYLGATIQGSLTQISGSLMTVFGGPLSGIFLYSIFCPWATKQGAIVGGVISMSFVFWVSMGQNFSKTVTKQPWLPPNPTDGCFGNNTTAYSSVNYQPVNYSSPVKNLVEAYDMTMQRFLNEQPEGLDKLYSLSYQWFAAVGTFLTLFVGSIVSLVTGYPAPEEVDVRYLLPIGDTIFPYLPKKAKKFLEFGLNFDKREELLKMNSAANELNEINIKLNDDMISNENNGQLLL